MAITQEPPRIVKAYNPQKYVAAPEEIVISSVSPITNHNVSLDASRGVDVQGITQHLFRNVRYAAPEGSLYYDYRLSGLYLLNSPGNLWPPALRGVVNAVSQLYESPDMTKLLEDNEAAEPDGELLPGVVLTKQTGRLIKHKGYPIELNILRSFDTNAVLTVTTNDGDETEIEMPQTGTMVLVPNPANPGTPIDFIIPPIATVRIDKPGNITIKGAADATNFTGPAWQVQYDTVNRLWIMSCVATMPYAEANGGTIYRRVNTLLYSADLVNWKESPAVTEDDYPTVSTTNANDRGQQLVCFDNVDGITYVLHTQYRTSPYSVNIAFRYMRANTPEGLVPWDGVHDGFQYAGYMHQIAYTSRGMVSLGHNFNPDIWTAFYGLFTDTGGYIFHDYDSTKTTVYGATKVGGLLYVISLGATSGVEYLNEVIAYDPGSRISKTILDFSSVTKNPNNQFIFRTVRPFPHVVFNDTDLDICVVFYSNRMDSGNRTNIYVGKALPENIIPAAPDPRMVTDADLSLTAFTGIPYDFNSYNIRVYGMIKTDMRFWVYGSIDSSDSSDITTAAFAAQITIDDFMDGIRSFAVEYFSVEDEARTQYDAIPGIYDMDYDGTYVFGVGGLSNDKGIMIAFNDETLEERDLGESSINITEIDCSEPEERQFYVRWLNDIGGWDYQMFSRNVQETDSTTSQSIFEGYFDNVESPVNPANYYTGGGDPGYLDIYNGESERTVVCGVGGLSRDMYDLVKQLHHSPIIERYDKEKDVWLRIRIKNGSNSWDKSSIRGSATFTFILEPYQKQFPS